MTRKLYYEDSYADRVNTEVLSCESYGDGRFAVTLAETVFFPEGGGQPGDTGYIGGVRVTDTQESGDEVLHITAAPLPVGERVDAVIDFERRLRLMQNHGGEHIVSGIVNRKYGLNNVGFHMGSEDITIDYDGFLDRDALREVEYEANLSVVKNMRIAATYPSEEELATLHYRSKKALTGKIRIVTVEGFDVCACCAPHLSHTGEIGIIKILDSVKYKGGVRVHLQCGLDALDDYNEKYGAVKTISMRLSSPQEKIAEAVAHLEEEFAACRARCACLRDELLSMKIKLIEPTDGNLCLFEPDLGNDELMRFTIAAAEKCGGICAAFAGTDADYRYCMVSRTRDLRAMSRDINAAIGGRGGGSPEMIRGTAACESETLKDFIGKL